MSTPSDFDPPDQPPRGKDTARRLDPEVLASAAKAARARGLSVEDWLAQAIMRHAPAGKSAAATPPAAPAPTPPAPPSPAPTPRAAEPVAPPSPGAEPAPWELPEPVGPPVTTPDQAEAESGANAAGLGRLPEVPEPATPLPDSELDAAVESALSAVTAPYQEASPAEAPLPELAEQSHSGGLSAFTGEDEDEDADRDLSDASPEPAPPSAALAALAEDAAGDTPPAADRADLPPPPDEAPAVDLAGHDQEPEWEDVTVELEPDDTRPPEGTAADEPPRDQDAEPLIPEPMPEDRADHPPEAEPVPEPEPPTLEPEPPTLEPTAYRPPESPEGGRERRGVPLWLAILVAVLLIPLGVALGLFLRAADGELHPDLWDEHATAAYEHYGAPLVAEMDRHLDDLLGAPPADQPPATVAETPPEAGPQAMAPIPSRAADDGPEVVPTLEAEERRDLGLLPADDEGARPAASLVADLEAQARDNNRLAMLELGKIHAEGRYGVPRDMRKAAYWFHMAAEQNSLEAMYRLGVMHLSGEGVPASVGRAMSWLLQAAEEGHVVAQYDLGVLFRDGQGVGRDDDQAAKWFARAADAGLPAAMVALAELYEAGRGVPRDPARATALYRLAAAQGNTDARAALGQLEGAEPQGPPDPETEALAAEAEVDAAIAEDSDPAGTPAPAEDSGTTEPAGAPEPSGMPAPAEDTEPADKAASRTPDAAPMESEKAAAARQAASDDPADEAADEAADGAESSAPAEETPAGTRQPQADPPEGDPAASDQAADAPMPPQTAARPPRREIPPAPGRPPADQTTRELVMASQMLLERLGYNPGTPDGVTGDQTRRAVRAFQRDQGMPVTGQVTLELLSQLQRQVLETLR